MNRSDLTRQAVANVVTAPLELPPVGSRWYIAAAGRHYEVVEHTTKDGEPACLFRPLPGQGKREFVWIWRLVSRRAIESNGGAA